MSGEAIQEDVSGFGSDRLARMKELSQRRDDKEELDDEDPMSVMHERADQLNQELAEADDEYNSEPEPEPVDLPIEDNLEEEVEEEPVPQTVKLKVNGQEREMSLDQVIAIAQKQEAADARLQEAAQRMQEIERREQEFEAKASSQPSAQDVGATPSSDELKKMARDYHEALLDGDDDLADELFIQIQNSGRQQPTQNIDPDQLADQVIQKSEQRKAEATRQAEIKDAQTYFVEEFADIAGDSDLYNMADQITAQLMQEDPSLSPKDLVTVAGNRVREKMGISQSNSRTERKQRATGGMRSTNARKPGKPQPKAKTRADVLNEMRSQRGARAI